MKQEELLKYAEYLNANQSVIDWIKTHAKKYIAKNNASTEEIEHIIDYLVSSQAPKRIARLSYPQAKEKAEKWIEELNKQAEEIEEEKKDTKVILDFKDGFKVVQLIGKNAYEREGKLMRNCVSSYFGRDTKIYSLRDRNNNPHCTMEQDQQIKGKGNGDIHPKYVRYVVEFLEHIGMTVRDSEMSHLGYDVEPFAKYSKTPLFRNRYIRRGEKVVYKDNVVVYTEFDAAIHYKGNKICLFKGDIEINRKNVSLGKIQSVGGYIYINSNSELKAESLKSVGGYLSIYSNSELKAESLKSVGGYLSINSNSELKAESLKSVGGYIYINSNSELKAESLKSVGGYLSIYSNSELKAESLKSVGGDIYINSNSELPNLKSVGGDIYIYSNSELPNLKSVGGDIYIYSNSELKAESLKSVGGDISINSKGEINRFKGEKEIRRKIKIKGKVFIQ